MARVYFIIMDTGKARNDEEQMMFYHTNALNDMAGYLTRIADEREMDIHDLRLYVAPSKKVWDDMMWHFARRVAGKE